MTSEARYVAPKSTVSFFNDTVGRLTKLGISVYGSRVLSVRGRKTGEWRSTPVNPITIDGERYIVSPRGNTQWARNLRAANGEGELRLGRKTERFTATEIGDDAKPAILRAYLKKWKFEVGVFFDGVDANAPEESLLAIAPGYPVFRITAR
jgi:deazaflavin-dependent oxidoreductase (nitroreductase family)